MNLATSLGLYAAVSRELGSQLPFPGSPSFYKLFDNFTDSKCHARFCAWAATASTAHNQAFNVVNGEAESWQVNWPKLCKYFGMSVHPTQFKGGVKTQKEGGHGSIMQLASRPPIADSADELGLQGTESMEPSQVVQQIYLVAWSQRKEVREAWQRLAAREGLEQDSFEKATWDFLGTVLGRAYNIVVSMEKATKAGWVERVGSWDCLASVFDALKAEKILPKW